MGNNVPRPESSNSLSCLCYTAKIGNCIICGVMLFQKVLTKILCHVTCDEFFALCIWQQRSCHVMFLLSYIKVAERDQFSRVIFVFSVLMSIEFHH